MVPPLPAGVRYVDVDAEHLHTTLLRSDGVAVNLGWNGSGQGNVPVAPAGLEYVAIATSETHSAALRSDGFVVHWGTPLQVQFPPLPSGVVYVEIDGGYSHTYARRSDGNVVWQGLSGGHNAPRLMAGESYVELAVTDRMVGARVGPTSTYMSFANGCSGSMPATRLVPRDTPRIGRPHLVRLFDLPQSWAVMAFGWGRTPSVDLAPLGMPGCRQEISIDAAVFVAGHSNQAVYELSIPNWSSLVGLRFYNQAVVFDPGANPLGAVVSDAAEGVVGHW